MFWWNSLKVWSIQEFFFISSYCTVIFLLASLLYPPKLPEHLSCERHFFDNKSWFFGIQILAFLLDIPETVAKSTAHLRDVPREYAFYIPVILGICVIGLATDNRRVQAALPVAWLVATLSYLTLTSLDKIASG